MMTEGETRGGPRMNVLGKGKGIRYRMSITLSRRLGSSVPPLASAARRATTRPVAWPLACAT